MANLRALALALGAALAAVPAWGQEAQPTAPFLRTLDDWAEDRTFRERPGRFRLQAEPDSKKLSGGLYYDAGGGLLIGAQGRLGGLGGPRALLRLKLRF